MKRVATLSNSMILVLLLGTTGSLGSALGTMLMCIAVVIAYSVCMPPLRSHLSSVSAGLSSILLAATLTSCADILAQRWSLPWHQASGFYAGLIALQCLVLEHNGFFQQSVAARLKLGALFAGLMLTLAALRELAGHGRLGGDLSAHWQGLVLFSEGLHWITLVPGALIFLGLLLAAHQAWTRPNPISKETHRP